MSILEGELADASGYGRNMLLLLLLLLAHTQARIRVVEVRVRVEARAGVKVKVRVRVRARVTCRGWIDEGRIHGKGGEVRGMGEKLVRIREVGMEVPSCRWGRRQRRGVIEIVSLRVEFQEGVSIRGRIIEASTSAAAIVVAVTVAGGGSAATVVVDVSARGGGDSLLGHGFSALLSLSLSVSVYVSLLVIC